MSRLKILLNGAEVSVLELVSGQTYVGGRATGCEIPLGDYPGISRQHFRISDESGQWVMQVMSKFGEVKVNGEPVSEFVLSPDSQFRITPYDFAFIVEALPSEEVVEHEAIPVEAEAEAPQNALAPYQGGPPAAANNSPDSVFEGNEERTMIGRIESVPYLKISGLPGGAEETLRLEGNLWIAGREENCEIFLNDMKSSRKQFELASTPQGYFVTDLASSNGTLLNGSPLPPNQAVAIKSGDVISVGSMKVHFEVRDPNFKNKLVVIPQEILEAPPVYYPQASGGDIVPYGGGYGQGGMPGEMIPYDPNAAQVGWPAAYQQDYGPPPKKGPSPKVKFLLFVAIMIFGGLFIFSDNESGPSGDNQPSFGDPKQVAFQKLSDPQKKMVKDTYQLAQTLFMQKKFELAADQLRKIHEILPEGYEESHQIIEDVDNLMRDRQAAIAIRQEQERLEQQRREVEKISKKCEKVAQRTMSVVEIQSCIAPALAIDPENALLNSFVAQVEAKVHEAEEKKQDQKEHQRLVNRRRALYKKAQREDKSGDILGAISAYEKFLDSRLPDPDDNVEKAQARLKELKSGISAEIDRALAGAKKLYEANKLKEAHAALDEARKIAPDNVEVANLSDQIVRELNQLLKQIYSDSVLEESLGKIEGAREKWRKIVEIDRPSGEYYRRARSKLRQYGEQ